MSFQFNDLSDNLFKAVEAMGYSEPTEIQKKAIPFLLDDGQDFVGQAQTGTGKTATFLLPLLEKLSPNGKGVQALVITPTRELAQQVASEFEKFAKYTKFKCLTVYGGTGYMTQQRALRENRADVVIGTPGRLIDLIEKKSLKLSGCHHLVLDEADEMLNMGFLEDVEFIIDCLSDSKRIWMFSATMPRSISQMVENKFSNPQFISVKKSTLSNADVEQFYCQLDRRDFAKGLRISLEANPDKTAIVFCETKLDTVNLTEKLQKAGIAALTLNGDMNQAQRDRAMSLFTNGLMKVLVCTDVAARGIDVSHVSLVFNIGLPRQSENYVHRIGRTGRAGNKGQSISFIAPNEFYQLRKVERLTNQRINPYPLPKPAQMKKIKVQTTLEKLDGLKSAIQEKEDFRMDETFSLFNEYIQDLSRDQLAKLMFSQQFGQELRQLDQDLDIKPAKKSLSGSGRSRSRFSDRGDDRGNRSDDRGARRRSRNSSRSRGGNSSSRANSSRTRF